MIGEKYLLKHLEKKSKNRWNKALQGISRITQSETGDCDEDMVVLHAQGTTAMRTTEQAVEMQSNTGDT